MYVVLACLQFFDQCLIFANVSLGSILNRSEFEQPVLC